MPHYEINDPFQEEGPIDVRITIFMNESQTYYLTSSLTFTVTVRSKGAMEIWIDQDWDGHYNEEPQFKKGPLADYITRVPYIDEEGKLLTIKVTEYPYHLLSTVSINISNVETSETNGAPVWISFPPKWYEFVT